MLLGCPRFNVFRHNIFRDHNSLKAILENISVENIIVLYVCVLLLQCVVLCFVLSIFCILVVDAMGDHMVETYSIMGLVIWLYGEYRFLMLPHLDDERTLSIGSVLYVLDAVLSMCLLYVSWGIFGVCLVCCFRSNNFHNDQCENNCTMSILGGGLEWYFKSEQAYVVIYVDNFQQNQ